jgi:COMPASS component SWD3
MWKENADVVPDGDYGALENLLAKPGLLKRQTQKAFLYMCYRQQFLEHVENRKL